MLELRKKGNKHWLLIDEEIGEFTPSKFTINRLNNVINIVYFNNLKSKEYNVSDCYIFDIDDTSGFNTSSGVEFMDKLEELNCPCFQKDVNNFYISGGTWGSITGDIEEQADLQNALNSKLDKVSTAGVERAYIINADGSQDTKPTSDFKDVLYFANLASFPVTGETGKIYVALDTNFTYRWSGSIYVQIGGGEIYIENISVSVGYTVDFDIATHRLTLIGNTTFSEINLPALGFSKTITLHINGNFGVIFPASWTQYISGEYDGTATINTIVVEAFGSFRKVQISQPD